MLTFRVDLISHIGYRWIFCEFYFRESWFYQCFIYFDFFCGLFFSWLLWVTKFLPNFPIFLIALCGYKRLNSRLNTWEEIKRSRYNTKIYILLSMFSWSTIYYYVIIHESSTLFSCLYLYCFITCKVFLTWTSLIDREPNIKMQVLQILENKKTTTTKIRVDLIMQIGYRWIFWEDLDREKIGKNSRKSRQFVL